MLHGGRQQYAGEKGLFSSYIDFGKYDPPGTQRDGFHRQLAPRPPRSSARVYTRGAEGWGPAAGAALGARDSSACARTWGRVASSLPGWGRTSHTRLRCVRAALGGGEKGTSPRRRLESVIRPPPRAGLRAENRMAGTRALPPSGTGCEGRACSGALISPQRQQNGKRAAHRGAGGSPRVPRARRRRHSGAAPSPPRGAPYLGSSTRHCAGGRVRLCAPLSVSPGGDARRSWRSFGGHFVLRLAERCAPEAVKVAPALRAPPGSPEPPLHLSLGPLAPPRPQSHAHTRP
jgi:hypothetical protein